MTSDLTCKYTYKPCMNPRTTKRNGEPHTLCEYHRTNANTIQRAYATKKRQNKSMKQHNSSPVQSNTTKIIEPIEEFDEFEFFNMLLHTAIDEPTSPFNELTMTHEEFVILDQLF
ncbi:hypothetical protein THRCLA_21834 [Thraustotheca clavata]|uniref:Uncharacterized protein n=1 Tax=Thraustotheca clavata TaxID=74557 RepID=A0A1V9ZNB6_9STRA|nr:hypothetical protein THRCLA_21834 [Thraustotheca clavata]